MHLPNFQRLAVEPKPIFRHHTGFQLTNNAVIIIYFSSHERKFFLFYRFDTVKNEELPSIIHENTHSRI